MLPAAPLGAPSAALRALVGHGCGPATVVVGAIVVVEELSGGLMAVEVAVGELEGDAVVGGPAEVVDGVAFAAL
ncbi:MAG: hypothetical protein ACP5P1_13625 [Acidimicrobiales bacterium]